MNLAIRVFVVSIVLALAACEAGAGGESADGSGALDEDVREGGSDDWEDDPDCHLDCFGGVECSGGALYVLHYGPVPCAYIGEYVTQSCRCIADEGLPCPTGVCGPDGLCERDSAFVASLCARTAEGSFGHAQLGTSGGDVVLSEEGGSEVLSVLVRDVSAVERTPVSDTDSFLSYRYPGDAVEVRVGDEPREAAAVTLVGAPPLTESGGWPASGSLTVEYLDGSQLTAEWCAGWAARFWFSDSVRYVVQERSAPCEAPILAPTDWKRPAARVRVPIADWRLPFSVSGTVVASGEGSYDPAWGEAWMPGSSLYVVPGAEVSDSWFEIEDDAGGARWGVALDWPEEPIAFAVGEHLSVVYDLRLDEVFDYTHRYDLEVTVRRGDGSLALSIGEGGLATGELDDLLLTRGPERCWWEEGCGPVAEYDLSVATEDEATILAPGETMDRAGLRVYHGGIRRSILGPDEPACPDYDPDVTRVYATAVP